MKKYIKLILENKVLNKIILIRYIINIFKKYEAKKEHNDKSKKISLSYSTFYHLNHNDMYDLLNDLKWCADYAIKFRYTRTEHTAMACLNKYKLYNKFNVDEIYTKIMRLLEEQIEYYTREIDKTQYGIWKFEINQNMDTFKKFKLTDEEINLKLKKVKQYDKKRKLNKDFK